MSTSGVNLAVTADGAVYNKLRRPDDYTASLAAQHPLKSELPPAKRKFEAVDTAGPGNDDEPNTKRCREEHASKAGASPQRALAGDTRRIFRPIKETGMQTMFPGLDDDDSSDETTKDALAYLHSVRSEASTIPTLLVATPQAPKDNEPDRSMYNNGLGDHRAVYQNGTWVAVDQNAAEGYYGEDDDWSQYSDDMDPQAAYYKSLLGRYEALRQTLADADPKELASLVEADAEKYANVRAPYYKSDWRYAFDNKYPTTACVAQMDDKRLYRALEYVAEVLAIGDTISKQKSCWIWTLLAMAGDPGTLDCYKVGRIRELGHKAGQLGIRLRSGERRNLYRDDEEDVEEWAVEGEGMDGEENDDHENQLNEVVGPQENVSAQEERYEAHEEESRESEDEDNNMPAMDLGGQLDGADDRDTEASLPPVSNGHVGVNGDKPMSEDEDEDEGEIQDDEPINGEGPADLEAARARLLAQLGERLVTTSIPDRKIPPHQLRGNQQTQGEPRQGARHRHNGKVCKDPSCRVNKARQEAHRKAGLRAAQGKTTNGIKPETPTTSSQAAQPAANAQRQEVSAENVHAAAREEGLAYDDPPAAPESRPSNHIVHAEGAFEDARSLEGSNTLEKGADAEQDASSDSDSDAEVADPVKLNTRVTIDMILTVVGECYGQRDLLRFREAW